MQMESTRTKKTDRSTLALNTVRWLFESDTVEATKYLVYHRIPFQMIKSGEGYWLNISWKNGIIAPLSFQELSQLSDLQTIGENYGHQTT